MTPVPRHCRAALAWIAILALALRGLIPAGYMPDFSGHGNGLFALTVCDGVDHGMHHAMEHMHHHGGHEAPCPFSVGAIFSFDLPALALCVVAVFLAIAVPLFSLPRFRPQSVFSNASPRSPPVFS